jgi:UDP-GlcNAc3NAcA epimerase
MLTLLTVLGARPQFIKSAALSNVILTQFPKDIKEVTLHTGQHSDYNMSGTFFDELGLSEPDFINPETNFTGAVRLGKMVQYIVQIIKIVQPDYMLVYGDTDSTLAGAIAGAKSNIPVAHIEAGLRSFDRTMPEEVNRILTDHLSTFLFVPTKLGIENLMKEGVVHSVGSTYNNINRGVFNYGDVMFDNYVHYHQKLTEGKVSYNYDEVDILCTVHRQVNTDNPLNLMEIIRILVQLQNTRKAIVHFSVHPRTAQNLELLKNNVGTDELDLIKQIKFAPPMSYLETLACLDKVNMVITDSGGLQKESFFHRKPCIILRETTEWKEIIDCGAARMSKVNVAEVLSHYDYLNDNPCRTYPELYGSGNAASLIALELLTAYAHTN